MQTLISPPPLPTGKIKTFGLFGPKYQVGHAVRALDDGDWVIEVTLVDSGELAEYRYVAMIDDPEAS